MRNHIVTRTVAPLLLVCSMIALFTITPVTPARAASSGLLISEFLANPPGNDSPYEYVELVATQSIDFTTTPYSVVFSNNGLATANGWIEGGAITYGFNITTGTVNAGDVVYVGGSTLTPTLKLKTINTGTTAGDRFGNPNVNGVLGNGGANADGIAVFAADISTLTDATVPADAIFFGTSVGTAAVPGETTGYQLPINEHYNGGKLQATSFLAPDPGTNVTVLANGVYNTFAGIFTTPRTWTTGTIDNGVSGVAVVNTPLRIHDLQGSAHISPLNGQPVSSIAGIVTVTRPNGFYMQDPTPDSINATSEAIFVFTNAAPTAALGDAVSVSGVVTEFRPGGSGGATNLTTTEISTTATVDVTSSANPLPATTVIGGGGRVPPTAVIDDDLATGDVETGGTFDADTDGIDFYESLEAMRVQVNNAVVVGPTNSFGEIMVVGDNGAGAVTRTTRGGVVISATDFNPERIQIDDTITNGEPLANVGDSFPGAIIGVLDYSFGNYELLNTQALPALTSGGLTRETTTAAGEKELAVATFNVENLDPSDPATKFSELASLIVTNMQAPDLVALEEIQDNNGATNDGVVDATQTYNKLIAAITAAGGPTYQFRQIDPVNNQDGGEPGGNIRVGFLFRTDRGLSFTDRPGGTATGNTSVVSGTTGVELSASPGRIDPTNTAFTSSRKPLVGEFSYDGQKLFVIANHFNSKGGDQPLFGHFQPPVLSSETQRNEQAEVVRGFVQSILDLNSQANVIVLGDLNDFQFSLPLETLKTANLTPLVERLPASEQYTYVFEGNSQALDHILVSRGIDNKAFINYDIVHANAEFAQQASDHDPQVARFVFNKGKIIYLPLVIRP